MSSILFDPQLRGHFKVEISWALTEYQNVIMGDKVFVSPALGYIVLKDWNYDPIKLLELLPYKLKHDINQSAKAGKELIHERIIDYLKQSK